MKNPARGINAGETPGPDNPDLGPTAAIITIGDEIVEGRVLNKNATWLADELMARGVWPRVVVAVPDVSPLIVRVLRLAADTVDLLFVCGGLGFTPDDITRKAVATAFFRDVEVDTALVGRFRRDNARVEAPDRRRTDPPDHHHLGHDRRPDRRDVEAVRFGTSPGPSRLVPGPGLSSPAGDARAGIAFPVQSGRGGDVADEPVDAVLRIAIPA